MALADRTEDNSSLPAAANMGCCAMAGRSQQSLNLVQATAQQP
jgi:hypothetical protein